MTLYNDYGTYANRLTNLRRPQLYGCTDANIQLFHGDAGWNAIGPTLSGIGLPTSGAFTWLNQGSAAVDYSTGPAVLTCFGVGDGSNHLRGQQLAAPATPYGVFVQMSCNLCMSGVGPAVNSLAGLFFTNGSKAAFFGPTWRADRADAWEIYYMDTLDHVSSEPYIQTGGSVRAGFPWLAIEDGGTNRFYLMGNPDGNRFGVVYSEGRTTNFTASAVGFAINPCCMSTFQVSMTVYSWSVIVVPPGLVALGVQPRDLFIKHRQAILESLDARNGKPFVAPLEDEDIQRGVVGAVSASRTTSPVGAFQAPLPYRQGSPRRAGGQGPRLSGRWGLAQPRS